jgi:biotin transport system substrate-specific component
MSILLTNRATIVDRVIPRSLAADIALVVAGTALTAVAAQLAIPTQPVPFTFQTLAVLLVGASLGTVRGALSMALYALVGALGLPVFSGASHGVSVLFGATGGFIFGFIVAAALVGYLAEKSWSSNALKMFASYAIGSIVIYAVGIPVLAGVAFAGDLKATTLYMVPFMIWDVVKAVAAGALLPSAWKLVQKVKG